MPSFGVVAALLRRHSPAISLAILFAFLIWANIETPLWGDDYCEAVAAGWLQPLVLAWHDYFTWTGRIFISAVTYSVISTDPVWPAIPFDIANAAIFVCLVRNVAAVARILGPQSATADRPPLAVAVDITLVALLVWWLPRDIAEVALWKTGSIDYLWAMTGELWVLRWILEGTSGPTASRTGFAFIIATFLETISALVSALLVLQCLWRWRQRRPAPIALTAGHVLGTSVLLIAPGNFVRSDTLPPSSLLDRLDGLLGSLGSLFDVYWIPAVAIVVLALRLRTRDTAHESPGIGTMLRAGRGWMLPVLALIYMLLLLALPRSVAGARVSLPASIFLVCYLVTLVFQRPVTDRDNRLWLAIVLLLAGAHLAVVIPDLRYLAQLHRAWPDQKGPDTDVTLPLVRVKGRTLYARKDMFFEGLTADPTYFVNRCYASAMHMNSVRAQ
jgi:hypothetical protein